MTNDLFYWPTNTEPDKDFSNSDRFLVVGSSLSQAQSLSTNFSNARLSSNPADVPSGIYIYTHPKYGFTLLVLEGTKAIPKKFLAFDYISANHPLSKIVDFFEATWESGVELTQLPKFEVGDLVRILDLQGSATGPEATGEVISVRPYPHPQSNIYLVQTSAGERQFSEESLDKSVPRNSSPREWVKESPANALDLSASLTCAKLHYALTDTIYSKGTSKTIFRPYQFKPVLKLLQSTNGRLLIADEVGLGKTIEAGLIWNELEQRVNLGNVLIICPSRLTNKWQGELLNRFSRTVRVLKAVDLKEKFLELKAGRSSAITGIVSLETLRGFGDLAEFLELAPRFGLVVIDEAHNLRNRATNTAEAAFTLSLSSDNFVLMTATPINLGNSDLYTLLNMLDAGAFYDPNELDYMLEASAVLNDAIRELGSRVDNAIKVTQVLERLNTLRYGHFIKENPLFSELNAMLKNVQNLEVAETVKCKNLLKELSLVSSYVTRTRQSEVNDMAQRNPVPVQVAWTEEEDDYYQSLYKLTLEEARHSGHPPAFKMQMPLRQASSCIPASMLLQSEKRMYDLQNFDAPEFYEDLNETGNASQAIDWKTNSLEAAIKRWHKSGSPDTKYDRLLATISNIPKVTYGPQRDHAPMLLFSFFKATLRYLETRLKQDGVRVARMDGDTPLIERHNLMRQFRKGEFDILLASEVASEGLDFEFCNAVINYDLPWNPMKVEQRIGRLVRIGQKNEKVHIVYFEIPNTIETDILVRLYQRIRIFEKSIGEVDSILANSFEELQDSAFDPNLTLRQREQKQITLEKQIHERAETIRTLEENAHVLMSYESAELDDVAKSLKSRHIGPIELINVLTYGLAIFDSTIEKVPTKNLDDQYIYRLKGTRKLGNALTRARLRNELGTFSNLDALIESCSQMDWISLTTESETAADSAHDLMSIQHPIARTVVNALKDELAIRHFGHVSVSDSRLKSRILIGLYLAKAVGASTLTEIWHIGIDTTSGEHFVDSGEILLQALSNGELKDAASGSEPFDKEILVSVVTKIQEHMMDRHAQESSRHRIANENLVNTRLETLKASAQRKLEGIQHRLSGQTNEQYIRMMRGQIVKTESELELKLDDLESKRHSTFELKPLAFVLVEPA